MKEIDYTWKGFEEEYLRGMSGTRDQYPAELLDRRDDIFRYFMEILQNLEKEVYIEILS